MTRQTRKRDHWGSRLGVVLAVAGSAVGLGNFIRFPGQVVLNGGGAFMIPYLISLLLVGIPLAASEWALGRFGGRNGARSQMGVFYLASGRKRCWGIVGGLMTIIPFAISMYYVFIEAWCVLYALQYLGGMFEPIGLGFSFFNDVDPGLRFDAPEEYMQFFNRMIGKYANGSLFRLSSSPLLLATVFCALGNMLLISRGIAGGIEKVCKFAAPLVLACSLLVIVRVVTLGNPTGIEGRGFLDGLGFMWNPTRDAFSSRGIVIGQTTLWESLKNPDVWLAATAQIFFTLSLCWCCITTYASYLRKRDDVALSSLSSTSINEFCEVVLGGLMTIPPVVMFLGQNAGVNFHSTYALGFSAMANVFGQTQCGQFVGLAFYLLLFTAAITTSVSLLQPTVALFQEVFQRSKESSAFIVGCANLVGTFFVCWFTKDLVALEICDFWISGVVMFVFAILQIFLVAFVWGVPAFRSELGCGAQTRALNLVPKLVKYVSFPYMTIIIVFWFIKNVEKGYYEYQGNVVARYALAFFTVVAAALLLLSIIATAKWKRESKEATEGDATESNS